MKTLTHAIPLVLFLMSSTLHAALPNGRPETVTREYDPIAVEKIHVQIDTGNVRVIPMARPKIVIVATRKDWLDTCTYDVSKSEFSEIQIQSTKRDTDKCSLELEIQMPKDVDLYVKSGAGNIQVTGLESAFLFEVGSGKVMADGKFTRVEGKSGSGDVNITGVAGGGLLNVGSGSVNVKFLEDLNGKFLVETGSGNATLAFPKGSKINAKLSTGTGELQNELGTSDSAKFGISAKAGSGNLNIEAY
jgi:DUF4097 and DUF4098 domain-containing protein YvlB